MRSTGSSTRRFFAVRPTRISPASPAPTTDGKSSLPLRIAELSLTRAARADETVSCQLTGREQAGVGAVTYIGCVDAEGAAIFSLRGVDGFQVDSYWNPVTT